MGRNNFYMPATGTSYDWDINHSPDGEDDRGRTRPLTRIANTVNDVAAWSQGDEGSEVITLKGDILKRDQHRQFLWWYRNTQYQTMYFTDFDGQKCECVMSSYQWHRVGHERAVQRDPSMPDFKIVYTMQLTVMRFLSGDEYDEMVNP